MGAGRGVSGGARLALALGLLAPAVTCGTPQSFAVDGARAHARVVRQVEFGPRIPGSSGHARMREWLAAELKRCGAHVEPQRFVDSTLGRPVELVNLIARFEGTGKGRDRRVVLAAHYDTRPWCDQDPDSAFRGQPVPGANDGGSGVAVLLEVAELLSRRAAPSSVELVFFDGEDQGDPGKPDQYCLGSRGYAARLGDSRPSAAFVFDMVGDRDLNIHPEVQSTELAANLAMLVLEGARATGASHFHPDPKHRVYDDHIPLLEAGLPAVDVIDFDYAAWHTRGDLPDRVSAESLAEVARVAAWLVYASPVARGR